MALYNVATAANGFNVRSVEAGDAPEMVTRLLAAFAAAVAAGEANIADIKLNGAGAGPLWQAWFVSATASVAPTAYPLVPLADAQVVAAVAGNPIEAALRLNQQLAAASADNVFKVETAGGGSGPTYMALALFTVGPC